MRRATTVLFIFLNVAGSGALVDAQAAPKKAKPAPEQPLAPAARGPTSPAEVTGRYTILRGGKDTGCMLTLNASSALLAPACRDNGIAVFDPKGWSLIARRLHLRARKGHSTVFEMDEAGVWQKDPREPGKPLGLRKM